MTIGRLRFGRPNMYIQILMLDNLYNFMYNISEVKKKKKLVMEFGFGLICFFFLCMFVIGSQFIWGVLVGALILGFGWLFWEE